MPARKIARMRPPCRVYFQERYSPVRVDKASANATSATKIFSGSGFFARGAAAAAVARVARAGIALAGFPAAAAAGLVQAEGLQAAGDGEEQQGRRGEHAEVEVHQAAAFEDTVGQ